MHKISDDFEFQPDRTTDHERHESLVEFDFGPNQTTLFGVTCP